MNTVLLTEFSVTTANSQTIQNQLKRQARVIRISYQRA